MITSKLAIELDLVKLSDGEDREIASCYISDMLSRVLGGCKSGDVLITVQTSLNMVAVAVMTEAACVILTEGLTVSDSVAEKANEEGLTIYSSKETAFSLGVKISDLLKK